jgi:hypothetical protein
MVCGGTAIDPVLVRDALDRASRAFALSIAEFQESIQSADCSSQEADLRLRSASRAHAEAADNLLLALVRFESYFLNRNNIRTAAHSDCG